MNHHLVLARTAYMKQKKIYDTKLDALHKCEATNKIKIPKKGKIPASVTEDIHKDCAKELNELKVEEIPYNLANKHYTEESIAFKKVYGGDDAKYIWIGAISVICCGFCVSYYVKKKRHEKGMDVNFIQDENY